jgi:hypothetical protein
MGCSCPCDYCLLSRLIFGVEHQITKQHRMLCLQHTHCAECTGNPDPAPAQVTFACPSPVLPGVVCNATCAAGYIGTPSATCLANGTYSDVSGNCSLIREYLRRQWLCAGQNGLGKLRLGSTATVVQAGSSRHCRKSINAICADCAYASNCVLALRSLCVGVLAYGPADTAWCIRCMS